MKLGIALLASVTVLGAPIYDALACGGCFTPPTVDSATVVSGHRMVMSISAEQTVLWDQIQYQGSPEDFAWVLPVKPGARIEEASDAFFEALEATTRTVVTSPEVTCGGGGTFGGSGSDGCSGGCSAGDASGDGFEDGGGGASGGRPPDPVEVVHQGSVGPYETVTLSTMTPGALNIWLEQHGYNVTADSQPVIDAYVAEGFDFIALRLQPGQGVQQMKPVRVIMPGSSLSLPLRMVAIGTGAETPIVLYLVGEGRYTVETFTEAFVPFEQLSWDFATNASNYEVLRQGALRTTSGGSSFLTSYASSGFFSDLTFSTESGPRGFLDIFGRTAIENGEAPGSCPLGSSTGQLEGKVVNPCPAGEPFDSQLCGQVDFGEVDARSLGCDGAYDVSQALVGMRVEDAWVTRLEGLWPRDALAADLTIGAADVQTSVRNQHTASIALNEELACQGSGAQGGFGAFWQKLDPPRRIAPWSISLFALAFAARRLSRLRLSGRRLRPA